MNFVFSSIMLLGPKALLLALLAVPVYYMIYRSAPEPKQEASLARYLLFTLGIAALAYAAGTVAGLLAACSIENASNLCGLVGFFGLGPFLSAVAIFGYVHFWAKRARQPQ